MTELLCEKYRPQTLDEFIGEEALKTKIQKFIKNQEIENTTFYSISPGTGKTTLAKMLVKLVDCDYLYLNASDDNGIDTVREKVKQFASSASFKPLKVIILDEAAKLSWDAQSALLNIIESFSKNVRFILTCNYIEKIIEPLQSRCTPVKIVSPSKGDIARHLVKILEAEQIKYNEDLSEIKFIVSQHYPDLRAMLNLIQSNTVEGVLQLNQDELIKNNYKNQILEELKNPGTKTWKNIRQILADSNIDDYYDIFRFLFDNLDIFGKDQAGAITIYLEEYQYQYNFRIDKEICIMALIAKILQLL